MNELTTFFIFVHYALNSVPLQITYTLIAVYLWCFFYYYYYCSIHRTFLWAIFFLFSSWLRWQIYTCIFLFCKNNRYFEKFSWFFVARLTIVTYLILHRPYTKNARCKVWNYEKSCSSNHMLRFAYDLLQSIFLRRS